MTSRNGNIVPFLSSIQRAPEKLGLYIRASRIDRLDLLEFISAGDADFFGVVFDPTQAKAQRELREQVLARRIDVVLDPRTQPLATPGGYTESLSSLGWGGDHVHRTSDFSGFRGRQIVASIADFTVTNHFTQVLAPTHLIRDAEDEWLAIDLESTERLRHELDQRGASKVPIIYSLATSYALLRDADKRYALVRELEGLPIDALWIKVDGFGMGSTGAAVSSYLDGIADFHSMEIPVVADGVGGLAGLALMAFGGVGGIAHGVTVGESFNAANWRKARGGKPFGYRKRVYVPPLDLCLQPGEAEILFAQGPRAKTHFACRDTHCCPRGATDMLAHPARHFLMQRTSQIQSLSDVPESLRAQRFVELSLRSTRDKALVATRFAWSKDSIDIANRIARQRKRLDMMRITLGNLVSQAAKRSRAVLPKSLEARDSHATP